jgi:hypothetical protein
LLPSIERVMSFAAMQALIGQYGRTQTPAVRAELEAARRAMLAADTTADRRVASGGAGTAAAAAELFVAVALQAVQAFRWRTAM